jgi:hypothetical protein
VRNWPDHVTGDELVAAMDKVGVDGPVLRANRESFDVGHAQFHRLPDRDTLGTRDTGEQGLLCEDC